MQEFHKNNMKAVPCSLKKTSAKQVSWKESNCAASVHGKSTVCISWCRQLEHPLQGRLCAKLLLVQPRVEQSGKCCVYIVMRIEQKMCVLSKNKKLLCGLLVSIHCPLATLKQKNSSVAVFHSCGIDIDKLSFLQAASFAQHRVIFFLTWPDHDECIIVCLPKLRVFHWVPGCPLVQRQK